LSIVAKQKVLLFTVNITRNRMQNPVIKMLHIVLTVLLSQIYIWKDNMKIISKDINIVNLATGLTLFIRVLRDRFVWGHC
jgi:hypothetical protein